MKKVVAVALAATISSVFADCVDEAANYHKVDACLVHAIAQVESRGQAYITSAPNKNGSRDIGLMQINELWLQELKQHGISRADLYDRCTNAYVGSWVLAQKIAQFGKTWRAIGAYNAGPGKDKQEANRKIYVDKVWKAYQDLGCTSLDGTQATHHAANAVGNAKIVAARSETNTVALNESAKNGKTKFILVSEDH